MDYMPKILFTNYIIHDDWLTVRVYYFAVTTNSLLSEIELDQLKTNVILLE